MDAVLLFKKRQTYADLIASEGHCNPTTAERLGNILRRSGYEPALLETAQLYTYKEKLRRPFKGQPIADRNLYGVAFPCAHLDTA